MLPLSFETERLLWVDGLRARSPGEGGSDDIVVRRDEGGFGDDTVGRRGVKEAESSVDDELALDVLIEDKGAPCRLVGGGGGGAALKDEGLEVGSRTDSELIGGNSVEC